MKQSWQIFLASILCLQSWAADTTSAQPTNETAHSTLFTIVALGDSITDGYGLEKAMAYPSLIEQSLLQQGYSVKIINAGISGSTSASGPSRLKWFLKTKPDFVFLALGANDGLRAVPTKETTKNLTTIIEECKKNNIQIILAGMKMPPNFGSAFTEEYEKIFPKLALKFKLPFYPFLLDGVAGDPKLNQPDGIHPNEEGQKIIAKKIEAFLLKNVPELHSQKKRP